MARSRRDPAGYEVGYAKPPLSTRFEPGRSGNPRGRPKGSRSVATVLQAILNQKVAVTENGRIRKVAVIEVMIRRLVNDAMRSDPRALKLLLSMADRVQTSGEAAPDLGAMMAEDTAILEHYLGAQADVGPERETASSDAPWSGPPHPGDPAGRSPADEC
jgi:hypothetical protein